MNTYGSTPCRTAMSNLETLLRSYTGSNQSLETLFDNTFDQNIRMDLNGRTYKREFLLYQEDKNSSLRREVTDIEMEVLDSESFHFTYRIEDFDGSESSNDESSCFSSSTASISSTFHSLATVKNGKIVKIKPMTGSAYVELFESNIIYATESQKQMNETKQTQKAKKSGIKKLFSSRRSPVVVTAE